MARESSGAFQLSQGIHGINIGRNQLLIPQEARTCPERLGIMIGRAHRQSLHTDDELPKIFLKLAFSLAAAFLLERCDQLPAFFSQTIFLKAAVQL